MAKVLRSVLWVCFAAPAVFISLSVAMMLLSEPAAGIQGMQWCQKLLTDYHAALTGDNRAGWICAVDLVFISAMAFSVRRFGRDAGRPLRKPVDDAASAGCGRAAVD